MGRNIETKINTKALLNFAKVFLVLLAIPLSFILLVSVGAFGHIPNKQELSSVEVPTATRLLDMNGKLIGKYYIEERTELPFDTLANNLVLALLATEDVRFFDHKGVDFSSLGRVFFRTLAMGDESSGGGSTITQQLAKNLFPRKSYKFFSLPINKVREMLIAKKLEKIYSKEEILAYYLNTVAFGENAFGIASAARRFFNTSPDSLSPTQSAVLVGMLKGPTYYSPRKHPDRALERRNIVLEQMARYEYLDKDELLILKQKPLGLDFQLTTHHDGLAPYFREHLRLFLNNWCETQNKPDGSPYNLYTDGLVVTTTLDNRLQKYAEEAVESHLPVLQAQLNRKIKSLSVNSEVVQSALKRSPRYKSLKKAGKTEQEIDSLIGIAHKQQVFTWEGVESLPMSTLDSIRYYQQLLHAGFVAMDPLSGQIKVWVGGIDHHFFQYDHVTASRQTGSAFKPIVYGAALKEGYEPCEYTSNEKNLYGSDGDWTPDNADFNYGGEYSMEGALRYSVNVVAVKMLKGLGYKKVIDFSRLLGISSDMPEVPSLALGVADISPLELTAAFGTLTNGGKQLIPQFITRIEDRQGRVLWEADSLKADSSRVLPEASSQMLVEMLKNVVDKGTGRRLRTQYKLKGDIAGKTGTSQDQADGWFLAATPHLVGGAWVGADDRRVHFSTLRDGQGARTALPIWGLFLQKVQNDPDFASWKETKFPKAPWSVRKHLDCPPKTNFASQSEFQKWWKEQQMNKVY